MMMSRLLHPRVTRKINQQLQERRPQPKNKSTVMKILMTQIVMLIPRKNPLPRKLQLKLLQRLTPENKAKLMLALMKDHPMMTVKMINQRKL